jgi:hypothetical protein
VRSEKHTVTTVEAISHVVLQALVNSSPLCLGRWDPSSSLGTREGHLELGTRCEPKFESLGVEKLESTSAFLSRVKEGEGPLVTMPVATPSPPPPASPSSLTHSRTLLRSALLSCVATDSWFGELTDPCFVSDVKRDLRRHGF